MACPAAPWKANVIGPNFIMDDWNGEEKPECPLCLKEIEEDTNFFEATNSPGVACWECYLKYLATRIKEGLAIYAPPTLQGPVQVQLTRRDFERLRDYDASAAELLLANNSRLVLPEVSTRIWVPRDRLPLSHPKSLKRLAKERQQDRREGAYRLHDPDWILGEDA